MARVRSGQRTVMEPGSVSPAVFVLETSARFGRTPQSAGSVVVVTWTLRPSWAATSSGPHLSVCVEPASPVIAQLAQS